MVMIMGYDVLEMAIEEHEDLKDATKEEGKVEESAPSAVARLAAWWHAYCAAVRAMVEAKRKVLIGTKKQHFATIYSKSGAIKKAAFAFSSASLKALAAGSSAAKWGKVKAPAGRAWEVDWKALAKELGVDATVLQRCITILLDDILGHMTSGSGFKMECGVLGCLGKSSFDAGTECFIATSHDDEEDEE